MAWPLVSPPQSPWRARPAASSGWRRPGTPSVRAAGSPAPAPRDSRRPQTAPVPGAPFPSQPRSVRAWLRDHDRSAPGQIPPQDGVAERAAQARSAKASAARGRALRRPTRSRKLIQGRCAGLYAAGGNRTAQSARASTRPITDWPPSQSNLVRREWPNTTISAGNCAARAKISFAAFPTTTSN